LASYLNGINWLSLTESVRSQKVEIANRLDRLLKVAEASAAGLTEA